MSLPCPVCKASAQRQGFEFDGGYLHESRDYVGLLHCNFCGAYYQHTYRITPLRLIPATELRDHRRVSLEALAIPADTLRVAKEAHDQLTDR